MSYTEYKGYTIQIAQDQSPSSPREDDNLGTMICFHGRYNLGDSHKLSIDEAKRLETSESVIALPMYMYDHSGITINTTGFSCPFDSGKIGFIYVTKEKIRQEYSWKKLTKKRIEIINNDKTVDESCWGFYGSEDCETEAKGVVDYLIKNNP
jgi:hypothetical protein